MRSISQLTVRNVSKWRTRIDPAARRTLFLNRNHAVARPFKGGSKSDDNTPNIIKNAPNRRPSSNHDSIRASLHAEPPPTALELARLIRVLNSENNPTSMHLMADVFELMRERYPSYKFNVLDLARLAKVYVVTKDVPARERGLHNIFAAIAASEDILDWTKNKTASQEFIDRICSMIQSTARPEYADMLVSVVLPSMDPSCYMADFEVIYVLAAAAGVETLTRLEALVDPNAFSQTFYANVLSHTSNMRKRLIWMRNRESIKSATTASSATHERTQSILANVLEEVFRHKDIVVAQDIIKFIKEIDFSSPVVHGRLIQVYLRSGFKDKAEALFEEIRQKNVPLDATMFVDCATFTSRIDQYVGDALTFAADHPEMKTTLYSAALGARYFAIAHDIPSSLRLLHILRKICLADLAWSDELWSQAQDREVMLSFDTVEALTHFVYVLPGLQADRRDLQQQLKQALPSLIDNFLLNKFAPLPFVFNEPKGHIVLTPRITNTMLRLLEFVGPRKSVLTALHICMIRDDYPCVAISTAQIMFVYFSALRLIPADTWDVFSKEKDLRLTQTNYYFALKGDARLELINIFKKVMPLLAQMAPQASLVAAHLQSLKLELPDIRTVDY